MEFVDPLEMASGLLAFGDESMLAGVGPGGAYVLAATICSAGGLHEVRAVARSLLLPGQRKLHWRDESAKRKALIVGAISSTGLTHLVVVRHAPSTERLERRRRLCMEGMLLGLESRGVVSAVFESRGPADDLRDRTHLDAIRASHGISSKLRLEHAKGPVEPALWFADAVCGMAASHLGGDAGHLLRLSAAVSVEIREVS